MDNLIEQMNKEFPPKEKGGFNSAVFFHHMKDGKLVTCSPMLHPADNENMDIQFIVKRLLMYSDACKVMATEMLNKTMNKN